MNRIRFSNILFFIVLVAFIFTEGCNEVDEGYLVLERPENSGVINIRESKVDIDSSKSNTVLIGGEKKTLNLATGEYRILVHSKDPYDPNSKEYSWQSELQVIAINKQETTRVIILPDTHANEYCCGWLINN